MERILRIKLNVEREKTVLKCNSGKVYVQQWTEIGTADPFVNRQKTTQ